MSYVHLPYDSIRELVREFQCRNFATTTSHSDGGDYNFVLVNPSLYHGAYGGIVWDRVLETAASRLCKGAFLSSSIGHGMSIVWWMTTPPEFYGDMTLVYEDRFVAVTPRLYEDLTLKTVFRPQGRSSYYGNIKADRMKSASFSYSDSE